MAATLRSPRTFVTLKVGDLPAGGVFIHDLTKNPYTLNQCPYNTVVIQNFSKQILMAEYGDTTMYVPPESALMDPQAYGTRLVKITNTTSDPNDGLIHVVISRVVDSDAALVADICEKNIFDVANGLA